jgi:hypothetical protein
MPDASGTNRPLKAGSANRAGSGHGGSGESPDVRSRKAPNQTLPKASADLMPGSAFCFQPCCVNSTETSTRTMTTILPPLGIRIRQENPNHHLWNNHGTWFLHYTVYPTPLTKERVRRSLGTKDLATARRNRDTFFASVGSGIAA